jgi:hypothetical protein
MPLSSLRITLPRAALPDQLLLHRPNQLRSGAAYAPPSFATLSSNLSTRARFCRQETFPPGTVYGSSGHPLRAGCLTIATALYLLKEWTISVKNSPSSIGPLHLFYRCPPSFGLMPTRMRAFISAGQLRTMLVGYVWPSRRTGKRTRQLKKDRRILNRIRQSTYGRGDREGSTMTQGEPQPRISEDPLLSCCSGTVAERGSSLREKA